MRTKLSSKGQIVLPREFRQQDDIEPGQEFEVERVGPGKYLFRKAIAPGQPGLLALLLSCPQKDWFTPIPSESSDTLKNPFEDSP